MQNEIVEALDGLRIKANAIKNNYLKKTTVLEELKNPYSKKPLPVN